MKRRVRLVLVAVFLLVTFTLTGCGSQKEQPADGEKAASGTETIVIKAGHDGPTNGPWQKALVRFKELVEAKTNGRVKVETYPQGQLSNRNMRTTIELLQAGTIEMALFIPAIYEQFDRRWQVFSLPYLFLDRQTAYEVCDGEVGRYMLSLLNEKNIQGLDLWEHGFRNLTNSKKEVRRPEDLAGMKIRSMDSPTFISMFKSFGANPTVTSMGELFTALQQGVVDGQENPLNTIGLNKFYEVQKYLTLTEHVWNPLIVGMNKKFYDSLPEDIQQAIVEAVKETKEYERSLVSEDDEKMLKLLKEKMTVITLTAEEKKAWQEATKKIHDEFAGTIGKDIIEKFHKAIGQ